MIYTKGGAGEGIVIIAGIILAILALGLVMGENNTYLSVFLGGESSVSKKGCGLVITEPQKREVFEFPYTISGEATGCGWVAEKGSIGTVGILDNNGMIIHAEPIRVKSGSSSFEQQFAMPIILTEKATLRFTNNKTGSSLKTVDIPVLID